MKSHLQTVFLVWVFIGTLLAACRHKKEAELVDLPGLQPLQKVEDNIVQENWQFRVKTRSLYNASKFDELEALANQLRATRARFGNGSWKIYQFYEALGCRSDEPETMWQLHETIHEKWDAAKPRSITARVAHADFLIEYAWHARGSGYADTVKKEGWRLFGERLGNAKKLLDQSREFEPQCPMWWDVYMILARGQSWDWDDFEKLFQEAKRFEPQFFAFDNQKATYLLPRWHGNPGDWEYAASLEVNRPGGLGAETYARVVSNISGYYYNVFRESKASWPLTREGFELMRQRYPESLEILSSYCRLACLADDRVTARKLFDELGGRMVSGSWRDQNAFRRCRNWAYSQ
ncbi:MAG: hypothetical protein ABR514_10765 [Chthoniobacterales bacterium]